MSEEHRNKQRVEQIMLFVPPAWRKVLEIQDEPKFNCVTFMCEMPSLSLSDPSETVYAKLTVSYYAYDSDEGRSALVRSILKEFTYELRRRVAQ